MDNVTQAKELVKDMPESVLNERVTSDKVTDRIWKDFEIIHTYTRAQAIEDGVLVDVSQTAREAGIKYPVALTSAVWGIIENIPEKYKHEDIQGRLWDVVWMLRMAIPRSSGPVIFYKLVLHRHGNPHLTLKAICGPGDNAEPVVTVMLPGED